MSETETETPTPQEPTPQEPATPETPPGPEPTPETPETPEAPEQPAEQPEEPPQPAGMSEKEREKQQKALDSEAKRHTARVTDLLGADAEDVTECPFCDPQLLGFFYDAQLTNPRSEIQAAMVEALSRPLNVEYLPAPDVDRCESCDGYGKTDTRSRVPGNETKVCARCKGYGFFPPPGVTQNGPISQDDAHELVLAGTHEPLHDDSDPWGSPRLMPDGQENPNYGKMPQYKNPALP